MNGFSLPFQEEPSGCDADVGCFTNNCNGGTCRSAVTWKPNGNLIDFSLQLSLDGLSSNQWIALGLSSDADMVITSKLLRNHLRQHHHQHHRHHHRALTLIYSC